VALQEIQKIPRTYQIIAVSRRVVLMARSTGPDSRRIVPPQGKQSKTWQGGSVLDGQVDHSYASASGSLLDGQWIRFMLTIAEQGS